MEPQPLRREDRGSCRTDAGGTLAAAEHQVLTFDACLPCLAQTVALTSRVSEKDDAFTQPLVRRARTLQAT